ncbi:MAG: zf-HC2 domain-containing protein [Acutalibacteraceae bacterium]
MSLNCDNVKDFVSLYNDDCISENTKNQIDEHLIECKDCRKYYKSYENLEADDNSIFVSDTTHYEPNKNYGKLAKRLKVKSIVRDILFSAAILSSVFITLAVARSIWKGRNDK